MIKVSVAKFRLSANGVSLEGTVAWQIHPPYILAAESSVMRFLNHPRYLPEAREFSKRNDVGSMTAIVYFEKSGVGDPLPVLRNHYSAPSADEL